jgi:hypothetical protein
MKQGRQDRGFNFWRNVDAARGTKTMKEVSDAAGIGYQLIKAQRSDNTLPRVDNAFYIARALDTTCEFLMTGTVHSDCKYSDYIPFIKKLEAEDPEKLRVIREMLGMPVKKTATSDSGSMVG